MAVCKKKKEKDNQLLLLCSGHERPCAVISAFLDSPTGSRDDANASTGVRITAGVVKKVVKALARAVITGLFCFFMKRRQVELNAKGLFFFSLSFPADYQRGWRAATRHTVNSTVIDNANTGSTSPLASGEGGGRGLEWREAPPVFLNSRSDTMNKACACAFVRGTRPLV